MTQAAFYVHDLKMIYVNIYVLQNIVFFFLKPKVRYDVDDERSLFEDCVRMYQLA